MLGDLAFELQGDIEGLRHRELLEPHPRAVIPYQKVRG